MIRVTSFCGNAKVILRTRTVTASPRFSPPNNQASPLRYECFSCLSYHDSFSLQQLHEMVQRWMGLDLGYEHFYLAMQSRRVMLLVIAGNPNFSVDQLWAETKMICGFFSIRRPIEQTWTPLNFHTKILAKAVGGEVVVLGAVTKNMTSKEAS